MAILKAILLLINCLIVINLTNGASIFKSSGKSISHDKEGHHEIGEFGDKFEGDIILTNVQRLALKNSGTSRNGLRSATKRWPDKVIIYHINKDNFDDKQISIIKEKMADIANKSCLKFRPRKCDNEYAVIIQGSEEGCFSNVGYSANDDSDYEYDSDEVQNQVLNLASNCFKDGIVVHEMLHTIGFYHMQSTYDRDDYVKINWENITPGKEQNFAKFDNDTVTDFGVSYDYGSVMHYPEKAFSINGEKTMEPLQENVTIGQRNGLSESDVLKLNKMYCDDTGSDNE